MDYAELEQDEFGVMTVSPTITMRPQVSTLKADSLPPAGVTTVRYHLYRVYVQTNHLVLIGS